jgi:hypothetical protein
MSNRTQRITRIGSVAGYVVAVSGVVGAVFYGVALVAGGPTWVTLYVFALVVLVAALAPLMLSFYELGGLTPTRLAQVAQALGWASALTWCVIQVPVAFGVEIEWPGPAAGAFAIASLALGYIGLWIAGANLLAGRWLGLERWLGVLAGVAVAILATGLLRGGVDSDWITLGGIGLLVAAWAFLMGRLLGRLSAG